MCVGPAQHRALSFVHDTILDLYNIINNNILPILYTCMTRKQSAVVSLPLSSLSLSSLSLTLVVCCYVIISGDSFVENIIFLKKFRFYQSFFLLLEDMFFPSNLKMLFIYYYYSSRVYSSIPGYYSEYFDQYIVHIIITFWSSIVN